jgi:hypothetical protein
MAIYGALAENTRRNERVERGVIAIAASANGTATIALGTISGTVNVGNFMRQITHFQLTVDDLGTPADGVTVTKPAFVTGSLNAAGTILTINLYVATSNANPTLIQTGVGGSVRYQLWGNLAAGTGF